MCGGAYRRPLGRKVDMEEGLPLITGSSPLSWFRLEPKLLCQGVERPGRKPPPLHSETGPDPALVLWIPSVATGLLAPEAGGRGNMSPELSHFDRVLESCSAMGGGVDLAASSSIGSVYQEGGFSSSAFGMFMSGLAASVLLSGCSKLPRSALVAKSTYTLTPQMVGFLSRPALACMASSLEQ